MTAATTISAASLGRIAELQARLRELASISRALAKSKRRYRAAAWAKVVEVSAARRGVGSAS
jgi:hypothetical protein